MILRWPRLAAHRKVVTSQGHGGLQMVLSQHRQASWLAFAAAAQTEVVHHSG